MQDGHHLTNLLRLHQELEEPYLDWVAEQGYDPAQALPNYRRALVAYYEARLDPLDAPTGDPLAYLTALAGAYYGDPLPPGYRLPTTLQLDDAGRRLLAELRTAPNCKELLLLADYHQLAPPALARAYEQTATEVADRLTTCRQTLGLPLPTAPQWRSVITLAGRQDLIATLQREEAASEPPLAPASPAPAPRTPPRDPHPVLLTPRRPAVSLPTLPILLAGILFGVLGWLAYDTFGRTTPDGLFATYFEPYPNIFATTPPATEAERDLQRILYYYDRGDYRTAYDELLPTATAYPAAPLYLGVCALALHDPTRARQWLTQLPADSPYRDAAEWYEALALLDQGASVGAKQVAERLASAVGHPYRSRAQQLLSDL